MGGVITESRRTEGVREGPGVFDEKRRRLLRVGLHFCRNYGNLVRYDPDLCDGCPHNGLGDRRDGAPPSETGF